MSEFIRENRYIVFKIKNILKIPKVGIRYLNELSELCEDINWFFNRYNIKPIECVCVESDWPEYEIVWKMLEDRMLGSEAEEHF